MAATVIDSLVLELGFDIKDLAKGREELTKFFKQVAQGSESSGKKVDESARKQRDSLVKLRNELVGLLALFTAGRGIKDFIRDVTTTNAALGRFTDMLGLNTKEVAGWRAAASLMGVSAGDVDASFQSLTTEIQRFALTGQSSVLPWFRMVGIQFTDLHGKAKDAGQIFLELADKMKGVPRARAFTILQQMGLSTGMIQIILQGRTAVQQLLDYEKAYADQQTKDAPLAAARLKAWQDLSLTLNGLATAALDDVTPALTQIATSISNWFKEHPDLGKAIVEGLTGAVLAFSAALTIAGLSSLAFASGPGIIVVSALVGIGEAIYSILYLKDHWNEFWDEIAATAENKATSIRKFVDFMLGPLAFFLPKPSAPYNPPTPTAPPPTPAAPATPPTGRQALGVRNNNPLNLRNWGVTPTKNGFAVFATPEEGLSAAAGNLGNYGARGWNTPAKIAEHWTENASDRPNYAKAIAAATGVGINDQLNLRDPAVLQKAMSAMIQVENGSNPYSAAQLHAGIADRLARYAGGVAAMPERSANVDNSSKSTSTTTTSTHIGNLNVYSSAANAPGIAADIRRELEARNATVQQANGGPT